MRTLIAAVALALVAAVAPAAATAKLRPIPPSNPAANQYVEPVPTAGGSNPSSTLSLHPGHRGAGAVPGTPAGGGALPAATGRALAKSGTTGVKAAIFAQATAPTSRAHRRAAAGGRPGSSGSGGASSGASGSGAGSPSGGSARASSPTMAVVRSVTGLDGVGAALPLILIVLALAISGVAVYRRATN